MNPTSRTLAVCALVVTLTSLAGAQDPEGPDFRVNTYTEGEQIQPAVASTAAGDFIVTWASYGQDGSSWGIYAQLYDGRGEPRGAEFRVNTFTPNVQFLPRAASDARGSFVIVWNGVSPDGSYGAILAQRYAVDGSPVGGEFLVGDADSTSRSWPEVAASASGDFVVVWSYPDGHGMGVAGRRFDANGEPQGGEFLIHPDTSGDQLLPTVAVAAGGESVVVWTSAQTQFPYDSEILGQRLDRSGALAGGEFAVNTHTTGRQVRPAVTMDGSGAFVVTWLSPDGSGNGVFARRYDRDGNPVGDEFQVNTVTTGNQGSPRIASDSAGNFVITWFHDSSGGYGIFGRRYRASGAPLGDQFTIDARPGGFQSQPAVASDHAGDFVVVWQGLTPSGYGGDVSARRFGP